MLLGRKSGHIKNRYDVNPDEVFLDSINPNKLNFDTLEGKFERPISTKAFILILCLILFSFLILFFYAFKLQILEGEKWFNLSQKNYIKSNPFFASRGVIKDRNGVLLAWNEIYNSTSTATNYIPKRFYIKDEGFSHVLGYISYPKLDRSGIFWQTDYFGVDGLEKIYNNFLSGKSGERIVEVSADGKVVNDSIINYPKDGEVLNTNLDVNLQKVFYKYLEKYAKELNFEAGSAIVMNVENGEVLVLTNYPEYSNNIFINASSSEEKEIKNNYLSAKNKPLLNRAIAGLIVPGSTVKPFVAYAALNEGVIDEFKNIYSSGALVIKNKYGGPDTIFRDWKAHGYVDARKAIAVSSDEYFYQVGGGFENQKGIGIRNIEKYMKMFGFASTSNIDLPNEKSGIVPSPEWKKKMFKDGEWLLGNTYHTAIGQYGFQTTPLELIRAIASIANGGKLVTPKIVGTSDKNIELNLNTKHLKVVREGMLMASQEGGTAHYFKDLPFKIASKTGTAQLGLRNERVNTWVVGYFPYDNPKFAFVFVLENGPASNTIGAAKIMKEVFNETLDIWREYIK